MRFGFGEILGLLIIGTGLAYAFNPKAKESIDSFLENLEEIFNQVVSSNPTTRSGNTPKDDAGGYTGGGTSTGVGTVVVTAVGDIDQGYGTLKTATSQGQDVLLMLGDYGYSTPADQWWSKAKANLGNAHVLWSHGNHDGDGYLKILGQSTWQLSETIKLVKFINIDTEDIDTTWIEKEIQSGMADNNVSVIIPFMHKVVYTGPSHHRAEASQLHNIFKKYTKKIKLVLQAHNHVYVRMKPLDGIVYVTNGIGGRKKYDIKTDSTVDKAFNNVEGILKLVINNAKIDGKFISNSNSTMDTFTISVK